MSQLTKHIDNTVISAANAYENVAKALPVKVELPEDIAYNIKVGAIVLAVLIILKGVLSK